MKIEYSPGDDILYIKFRNAKEVACRGVTDTVYFDLDADDNLSGIEIHNASHQVGKDSWTSIDFAGLLMDAVTANTEILT